MQLEFLDRTIDRVQQCLKNCPQRHFKRDGFAQQECKVETSMVAAMSAWR